MGVNTLRTLIQSVWAVLLTVTTVIFGAVPLRMMRSKMGRGGYWLLGAAISTGLWFLPLPAYNAVQISLAFASMVTLMGVYHELEETGLSFWSASIFTLLINVLLASAGFVLWLSRTGGKGLQIVQGHIESQLAQVLDLSQMQVDLSEVIMLIMVQVSVMLVMSWLLAIFAAVVSEPWLGDTGSAHAAENRAQALEFRMSDASMWLFIVSLFGTFSNMSPVWLVQVLGCVLVAFFLLFYLQGVAVAAKTLDVRVSGFMQPAFLFLLVLPLWPVVMLMGFSDHWLDYRTRLNKRTEALKKDEV